MAKKSRVIRFFSILALFPILLCGSAEASARSGATSSVYLPLVMRDYQSWSTNFANVTDLNAAEIYEWSGISDAQLSINTTNVHSGGKSIKDSGTIDAQHGLQPVFYVHGLTGQDTIDLSDKTLSIEMYVPSGSPLDWLSIELDSGSNSIIVRANIYPQEGRWYTYQADLNMVLELGSWQYYDWLHSPAIATQADALNLLQHVQLIKINGQTTASAAANAYFLIDWLGWESSGPLPAYNPAVDSLRKYADLRNLPIGSEIDHLNGSDPQFMRILLQEFNLENNQKPIYWPSSEPAGDNFDTFVQQPTDIFLENVAGRLGTPLARYLVFGNIPDWLTTKSYTDTQTILENYVRAQVSHHKGKTKIWFLFNELLRYDIGYVPYTGLGLKDRNQSPQTWDNNYSPFSASPSDVTMIEDAYRVAHEADPDAWLFILDGANEEMGQARPDAFYNLVAKLVSDGTPIDGVGLQAHMFIGQDGEIQPAGSGNYTLAFNSTDGLTGVAQTIERFQALGLQVVFAEVDAPIYLADIDPTTPAGQALLAQRLQIQAEVYRSLLHITLTHSNMPLFILFGWADQPSWVLTDPDPNRRLYYGDPGIYDVDYRPKPSYDALLDELKTPSGPIPDAFHKTSPADKAYNQPTSLTLSWEPSTGSTSYEYCFDSSPNNSCDTSWVSTGTGRSVDVSGLTPGTTYSWQVRARNAAGLTHADGAAWWWFTVPSQTGTDLALQKPVTVSSEEDAVLRPPEAAVDGSYATRWASAWSDPQWIQVDLGAVYDISRVVLHWEAAYATAYQIQVSTNGTAWTTIYSTTTGDGGVDDISLSGSRRYIRMYGTVRGTPWGYSLWEFEVYGAAP